MSTLSSAVFPIRNILKEEKMYCSLRKIFAIGLLLVFVLTLSLGTSLASSTPECDPAYVKLDGEEITVYPNGVNDTANLQCAFDAAVAAGPGSSARLVEGTYHTAQIVVTGFYGQFSGAGVEKTLVLPLVDLFVTPVDFPLQPPSTDNPWPVLFFFIDGDYSISNIAFRVEGEKPTQGWFVGEFGPIYELACMIAVAGTEAHADISQVSIEGERVEDSVYGYNLINGIYIEGVLEWLGPPTPPLAGTFHVTDSTFRTIGSGTPITNVANATILISHNEYEDMFWGSDASDILNSSVEFSHNNVTSAYLGFDLYSMNLPEITGSTFVIKNNRFSGAYGILIEPEYGSGNRCLLLGNNVQQDSEIGIFLGESTEGCIVVGGSSKTNVLDLGTDNVLVGVNNMGTGIGPAISDLMRKP
jgi:hypothetical protein